METHYFGLRCNIYGLSTRFTIPYLYLQTTLGIINKEGKPTSEKYSTAPYHSVRYFRTYPNS